MGQENSLPVGDREEKQPETPEEYLARCRANIQEAKRILGVPLHEPKECRHCGAKVFWASEVRLAPGDRLAHGVRGVPVDAAPTETGRVQLKDRNGLIVAVVYSSPPPGTKLRTLHADTCDRRADWVKEPTE